MDAQQLQMIFMTEVMPLISQGMATGFNCQFVQNIIQLGEKKLQEFVDQWGMDFVSQGVIMVVDFILTTVGVKHECTEISENALFWETSAPSEPIKNIETH